MTFLAASDSMMTIATTEAMAAGLILTPAMWVNFEFKASTGKATDLEKAGNAWRQAADQIQQTAQLLQEKVSAISGNDWTADDRKAYESKVKEFVEQLDILHTFCQAVGIALITLAYALFAYATFAVGMGTFLGALAIEAAASLAIPIVGEIDFGICEGIAATCLTITTVATGILGAAGSLAAMAFAGGSLLAAVAEQGKGNDKALGDWVNAQKVGAAGAAAALVQNGANLGLNYLNRTGGVTFGGGGKGSPFKSIDIDADRDKDQTWNVGGTATVGVGGGELNAGGHVKYGDHGLQGIEGEGKYTTKGGVTAGGKGGWEEDAQGNDRGYGSVNGGYTKNGIGGTGEVGGKYGEDGKWDFTEKHGATVKGGQAYTTTNTESNDGHGHTTHKTETETARGNNKNDNDTEKPPWEYL